MALRRLGQVFTRSNSAAGAVSLIQHGVVDSFAVASQQPAYPLLDSLAPADVQRRCMGVPKSKVSKHRRGMRNSAKGYRRIEHAAQCSLCGALMMPHHFCQSAECRKVFATAQRAAVDPSAPATANLA